jgi:hypothetical protein
MSLDARAVAKLASRPHSVTHYLYAPDSDAANAIATELKQSGFRAEERLSADGVKWLVLARHEIVPTENQMASLRQSMQQLVAPYDGEYDGLGS